VGLGLGLGLLFKFVRQLQSYDGVLSHSVVREPRGASELLHNHLHAQYV
jgi:hypothetical protein